MREVAYLFERFPSFGQTFCYREVAELERQGTKVHVFSIRRPVNEPVQDWNKEIVDRVHYLPEEKTLVPEIEAVLRKAPLLGTPRADIQKWGRQTDFLRLYQAIYVGSRLQEKGLRHLHVHFAGMAARTAYWIREFFDIPFTFTGHANDIFAPRDFAVSLPKLMESASGIVTVSDYAADFLKCGFPASAGRIHRIYNGVDLSRFPPADFGSEMPAIISIGRLIEKKGFADLIRACALLAARQRGFACEIIGEGPLEAALRAQIAEAGLEGIVRLAGPQTQAEIALRLARATIFVLPCTREEGGGMDNLPTVIMEAMAAGLPVISTPVAGVPEMVEHEVNGELVPEHDPVALCAALERMISDPDRARSLGDRGRHLAQEKFSIEVSARQLQQLFATVSL
jgi:glycosyltransferase involved in cell wall biosynthesis